jgi:hypothetical protein
MTNGASAFKHLQTTSSAFYEIHSYIKIMAQADRIYPICMLKYDTRDKSGGSVKLYTFNESDSLYPYYFACDFLQYPA